MRTPEQVASAISDLSQRRAVMVSYTEMRLALGDMHGVQDAASDVREIDAALAALDWVLEQRETIGR